MRLSKFSDVTLFSLVVLVPFGSVPGSLAQEPLRWKFEPGQRLAYNMVQDMTMGTSGPFGQQNVTMNQVMEMTWQVKELNDQGEAIIRQKFDRMKMKMTRLARGLKCGDFSARGLRKPVLGAARAACSAARAAKDR